MIAKLLGRSSLTSQRFWALPLEVLQTAMSPECLLRRFGEAQHAYSVVRPLSGRLFLRHYPHLRRFATVREFNPFFRVIGHPED